jgi:hypothetical protein
MSEVFVKLFMACFRETRDEEYCNDVVETVAELSETRRVTYRGKKGVTYVLNLPHGDQPRAMVAVDHRNKKGLVLTLAGEGYITFLAYEHSDGKFHPVHAEAVNAEIAAAANLNMPSGVLQRLLKHTA